jgi:predicted nucleic acid-binding protein
MIDVIVDTGVLIDALRSRDTPATNRLRELVDRRVTIGITDVIYAELRAGGIPDRATHDLEHLVQRGHVLRLLDLEDFDRAAMCRVAAQQAGTPVRSLADCLIASVCIREDIPLLHRDRDFTKLAACTDLLELTV